MLTQSKQKMMDRLLRGSIALFLFSLSLLTFQMCSKDNVIAQLAAYILPIATPTTLGGVKPDGTSISVDATGVISASALKQQNKLIYLTSTQKGFGTIWISNYDGTNPAPINILLAPTYIINGYSAISVSPDRKKIFFGVTLNGVSPVGEYSCNIDGSDITQISTGIALVNIIAI